MITNQQYIYLNDVVNEKLSNTFIYFDKPTPLSLFEDSLLDKIEVLYSNNIVFHNEENIRLILMFLLDNTNDNIIYEYYKDMLICQSFD